MKWLLTKLLLLMLKHNFEEAIRLRNEENIHATPQVIMVRAANGDKVRGTGLIRKYALEIMKELMKLPCSLLINYKFMVAQSLML